MPGSNFRSGYTFSFSECSASQTILIKVSGATITVCNNNCNIVYLLTLYRSQMVKEAILVSHSRMCCLIFMRRHQSPSHRVQ